MKSSKLHAYHLSLLTVLSVPIGAAAFESGSGHTLKRDVHDSIESAGMTALMSGEPSWWEDAPSRCLGWVTPSPAILMRFSGRSMECRDLSSMQCCDGVQTRSEVRACRFMDGDDWRILP